MKNTKLNTLLIDLPLGRLKSVVLKPTVKHKNTYTDSEHYVHYMPEIIQNDELKYEYKIQFESKR